MNTGLENNPDLHHFSTEAMATVFELWLCDIQKKYASQASAEAFNILSSMEQEISRYIENSEVSQIASLKKGQSLVLGPYIFECLQISKKIYQTTNGAFDITMDKEKPSLPARSAFENLLIDEKNYKVTADRDNIQIDFGGIAKGLALDKIAEIFNEWEIENFLIHGGYSSVLAGNPPRNAQSWPITLSNPFKNNKKFANISLNNNSISASGLRKGDHIINPENINILSSKKAVWAIAPDAAITDALSTAFMILSKEQVKAYCQAHPNVSAVIINCQNENSIIEIFGQHNIEIL